MKPIIVILISVLISTQIFSQDYRDKFVGAYKCTRLYNEYWITDTVMLYFEKSPIDTIMNLIHSVNAIENPSAEFTIEIWVFNSGHFYSYYSMAWEGTFFPENDSIYMVRDGGDSPNGHIFWFYWGKKINTSSINDYSNSVDLIKVYPNPVNTKLFIHVPETYVTSEVKYEVFDYTGKSVIIENFNHDGYIDFSNLSKGIYFLKIDFGKSFYCKKIIKN